MPAPTGGSLYKNGALVAADSAGKMGYAPASATSSLWLGHIGGTTWNSILG